MNVADLLQDTPSDRRRQPQREQPPPPQPHHREPSRERPPSRQQQHQQPPQLPPPSSYPPQQSSRNARPSSPPPREYPREYPPNHPPSQRLPPPSALMDFQEPMEKHRRAHETAPPPHMSQEMAMRQQQQGHPPPMGGPGHHGYPDHRLPPGPPSSRSQPPPQSHSHSHHGHGHPHSGHSSHPGGSPMYKPPPNSRNALPPSKVASSPQGPGMPPPTGHGSIPLYPTPVGPGVGPHMDSNRDPRGVPNFNEQSPMYNGPPSSMSRHPPPPGHPGHPHELHIPSRHRNSSSSGRASQASSPVMHSLQRQPYDDRDGLRGPHVGMPSHFGGGIGPGATSSGGRGDHRPPSNMNASRGPPPLPPQMLTGPGAGIHGESLLLKDRERMEWEAVAREREREDERMMKQRQREHEEGRARERDRRAIREEKDRAREREMREAPHDLMSDMLRGDRMAGADRDREREREHSRRTTPKEPFENPPYGAYAQPRYPDARRQIELEERDMAIAQEEEMRRARDNRIEMQRMQQEMARQPHMERSGREREAKSKDRSGEMDRVLRKERAREPPRRDDGHGWLPDPRPRSPEWSEKSDREWERRERIQRERELREREENDARRGLSAPSHHHHIHVHHPHRYSLQQGAPNPPPQATVKHRSTSRLPEPGEFAPPGALPSPFSSVINERVHKHLSKTPIGLPSGQPQQHLHPSQLPHIHPHGHPSPIGFPSRPPSPQQPMSALVAPGVSEPAPPKTPHPHLLPKLAPLHIGTFVYPRIPFPFLDFALQPPEISVSPAMGAATAGETHEIHLTIYVPAGFLPMTRPQRPRIWGGALVPNFSPLFPAPQRISHLQGGMPYGNPRPHPLEMYGTRRVYTDDSDLFLCALHSGWVSWSATRQARKEGKDLRLELRLSKEARFVGGLGAKFVGIPEGQAGLTDDDGSTLLSAGWGNGHDGSGMEILRAEFVKKGVAHNFSLRNRNQRLLEHSERSATLGCMPRIRKRRRIDAMFYDDCEDVPFSQSADADLVASRTIVLGCRPGLSKAGFKYCPDAVKSALFSTTEERSRPRKKPRLSDNNCRRMDVDGESRRPVADSPSTNKLGCIIIETLAETFLVALQDDVDVAEKENAANGFDDYLLPRRYTVSLIRTSAPEPAEKPAQPKSDAQKVSSNGLKVGAKQVEASAAALTGVSEASAPSSSMEVEPKLEAAEQDNVQGVDMAVPNPAETPPPVDSKDLEDGEVVVSAPQVPDESLPDKPSPAAAAASASPGPLSSASAPKPTDATPSAASPAPMDVTPSEPTSYVPDVTKTQTTELVHNKTTAVGATPVKCTTTIEVLQRNLTPDDILFDVDGISILSHDVENGMRKGWKIEARTWRWATDGQAAV